MAEGDHMALHIQDSLVSDESSSSSSAAAAATPTAKISSSQLLHVKSSEFLISSPECRICQEEDDPSNLESPCACSGSLKYAHRKCVQRWCNEKGDTTCEICHQPYKNGYSAPPLQLPAGAVAIDFSDDWGLPGAHAMELRDPRILALAAAQRHFLETEYEEYNMMNSTSAACCRCVALIFLALLLLRHTIAVVDSSADEDAAMFITIFLLRVVGFFLPCYIVARAMNMLEGRRQELQAATLTGPELRMLLQRGHPRSILAMVPAAEQA